MSEDPIIVPVVPVVPSALENLNRQRLNLPTADAANEATDRAILDHAKRRAFRHALRTMKLPSQHIPADFFKSD